MAFYLVGILLVLYSFYDYRKSFFLFIGFKFFLNTNITLVAIPGVPQLSLDLFLTIFFYLRFLSKRHLKKAKTSFPLLTPFIVLIISNFFSMIFAQAGIVSELSNFVKVIFLDYLMVLMVWEMIEDRNDFQKVFRIVSFVIMISCLYAIFEFSIQSNPLSLYEMTLNGDGSKVVSGIYEINARGYRVNSIFEHCIGAGITWGIYVLFVLYGYVYYKDIIRIKPYHFVVAALAVVCIFLTKMRSTLIFLALGSLGLISIKKKRSYVIVMAALCALIFVIATGMLPEEVIKIVRSITNREVQAEVSGSTLSMRLDQFRAAFELLKINPIFGLGDKFQSVISNTITRRLWGSESIWLMAITRKGLVGVIAVMIQFYYMIIKIPRACHNKNLFWLALAYGLTYTITSIPGTIMCWYYCVYSFYVKNSIRYQSVTSARTNEWRLQGNRIIYRKNLW